MNVFVGVAVSAQICVNSFRGSVGLYRLSKKR